MKNSLKIIPLGGLEEIGKNCTVLEYKNEIIIVDFGIKFSKEKLLGNILYYPDTNYLEKNFSKIKGIIITHGHLDHIGGLIYLLPQMDIPIFCSLFSKFLIENLFKKNNLPLESKINLVKDPFTIGYFHISPIEVDHSVSDSLGFFIDTPVGNLFITGDFNDISKKELKFLNKSKIDLLLADSTNSNKNKVRKSNKEIKDNLSTIIKNNGRIFLGQFSTQIEIIRLTLAIARKQGRIIIPLGRSIEDIFSILEKNDELLEYLDIIGHIKEVKNYPQEKIIFIATGSQGEKNSSLWKLAFKRMRNIELNHRDTLILSSSVIPGNELQINDIINNFYKQGAKVITNDDVYIHSSGHSYKRELAKIIENIKPRFLIPIHGEYKHLVHHKAIAQENKIPEENIFILENGKNVFLSQEVVQIGEKLKLKDKIILNNQPINNILIEEKKSLAEKGVITVTVYNNYQEIKINSLGIIDPNKKSHFHNILIKAIKEKDILGSKKKEKVIKQNIFREIYHFLNKNRMNKTDMILVNFV